MYWAHVLHQRGKIGLKEFFELSPKWQWAYIASEQLEDEEPVRRDRFF